MIVSGLGNTHDHPVGHPDHQEDQEDRYNNQDDEAGMSPD